MSLIGKKLIIVGANWADVAIGKLRVTLSQNTLAPNDTATLSAWVASGSATTCTATSSNTSYATVSARSGSGTSADPYVWTVTAVANGSAILTITLDSGLATEEVRTLGLVVQSSSSVTNYTITGSITNGSLTGATSIQLGGSASVTIVPTSASYNLPSAIGDITVTNATKGTYDSSTGVLTISNPTGNVTISTTCPAAVVARTLTYTYATAVSIQDGSTSCSVNPGQQTSPARNGGVIHLNAGDIIEPKSDMKNKVDFYFALVSSWSSGTTATCLTFTQMNDKPKTDFIAAGSLEGSPAVETNTKFFGGYRRGDWKLVAPYECVIAFTSKNNPDTHPADLTSSDINHLLITTSQSEVVAGGYGTVNNGSSFSYTYPTA